MGMGLMTENEINGDILDGLGRRNPARMVSARRMAVRYDIIPARKLRYAYGRLVNVPSTWPSDET